MQRQRVSLSPDAVLESIAEKLPHVLRHVTITEHACGIMRGISLKTFDGIDLPLRDRIVGRVASEPFHTPDGDTILQPDDVITPQKALLIDSSGPESVRVRSVLTCDTEDGFCARCYGNSLTSDTLVKVGEEVGTLAAETIANALRSVAADYPGMPSEGTGHQRGPRKTIREENTLKLVLKLINLLEARRVQPSAVLAETDGVVRLKRVTDQELHFEIVLDDDSIHEQCVSVPAGTTCCVRDGQTVWAGESLTYGTPDPSEMMSIVGDVRGRLYLAENVKDLFSWFGIRVPEKHLEILSDCMGSWLKVDDSGDMQLAVGEIVSRRTFRNQNQHMRDTGGWSAICHPVFLGISHIARLTAQDVRVRHGQSNA